MSTDAPLSIAIELADGTRFAPGTTCSGSIVVTPRTPVTCESLMLRCRLSPESGLEGEEQTAGQVELSEGPRDFQPDEPTRIPFEIELPEGPASYDGELFSIEWAIEAEATLQDGSSICADQPIELRATDGIETYQPGHMEAIGPEGAAFERPCVYWPDVYTCLVMAAAGLVAVTWIPHILWFVVALALIGGGGLFNLSRTLDLEGYRTRWPSADQSYDRQLASIGAWLVGLGFGVPLVTDAVLVAVQTGSFSPIGSLQYGLLYLPFWTRVARFLVVAAGVWVLWRTSKNWLVEWLVGDVSVEVEPTELRPGGAVECRCLIDARRGFELDDVVAELKALERVRGSRYSGSTGSYNSGGMRVYHTEHRDVHAEEVSLTESGTTRVEGSESRRFETTIAVPTDAPYSVQLPGSELRWELHIELETGRGWPWRYRVPLVVRPARTSELDGESNGTYGVEW